MTLDKPISKIIRDRIISSNDKFFSTDNISKHIKEGELELLINEVESKFTEVLKSLVINLDEDHNTKETARRVSKMYINELFSGRYHPRPNVTAFPNVVNYDQLYVTGPITIRSTCAHHLCAIIGKCYVGVFPGKNVIGLSKFNRIIEHVTSRPSIQEEMSFQIADAIEEETGAEGIAVLLQAEHHCMVMRGVKEHESAMTTSVMRGKFRDDPNLKAEFMDIVHKMP